MWEYETTDIVVEKDSKAKKKPKEQATEGGGERRAKQREGEHEREGDAESRRVSIDQVIKIDGCLDEYQPGEASAELSRDGLALCRHD